MIKQSAGARWRPNGLSKEVANIYARTAELLQKAGDLAGATEAVGRALTLAPDAPDSLCMLASLHSAIGQKEEALKVIDRVLVIDPSHARCSKLKKSIRNGNGAATY
jgi:tetratricopeptide (TPR) repeat protein